MMNDSMKIPLLQGFLHLESERNSQPCWLKEYRQAAVQWVLDNGLPTNKDESWRHTPIASFINIPFEQSKPSKNIYLFSGMINRLVANFSTIKLVFINGHFTPELSSLANLPTTVKVKNLATLLDMGNEDAKTCFSNSFTDYIHAFTALNAACANDGAFIQIPANTIIVDPIHLIFFSNTNNTPLVSYPRSLVLVGASSQATVVETYVGTGNTYLTNAYSEIILEEGAQLDHYKVQNETEDSFHIMLLNVKQSKHSQFTTHSVTLGSSVTRYEVNINHLEPRSKSVLSGLYMLRNKQHFDNLTTIKHNAPNCTSRELYKGVIDENGRSIFDGRIIVCKGAVKTDASMTNKNLLLSGLAQSDAKPRLEIFADDVKCTHGSTFGQLDENALFYLRSRGISKELAHNMLIYAFIDEVLKSIQLKPLCSYVEEVIMSRLPHINVQLWT